MRKFTLLFFICAFAMNLDVNAQCTPETTYPGFGIFPAPDTSAVLFSDPTLGISDLGCEGQDFEYTFTANIPDSINVEPFLGIDLNVPLTSIEVQDVDGFAAAGWTLASNVSCSQPGCFFTPMVSGGITYECAIVQGTAPAAGDYPMVFKLEGVAFAFGSNVPVSLDYPDGAGFPGQYILRVLPASDPACLVGTQNIVENYLAVSQNQPNPFNGMTEIMLNSDKASNYEFTVMNLLGEVIHREAVDAMVGQTTIQFDGSALSNGVYMYTVSNVDGAITRKMMVNQ